MVAEVHIGVKRTVFMSELIRRRLGMIARVQLLISGSVKKTRKTSVQFLKDDLIIIALQF